MIVRQANRYLIDGPVTLDTVCALLAEGKSIEGDDVVVDLAKVTGADSSALSLLLEWTRQSRAAGRRVAFANAGPNLRSLAELYGIVDLLPFVA